MANENSKKHIIAFAIGNIGGLAIAQSSVLLLYSYYFLHLKIPLNALQVSLVLVIYGVWDAINEPILGHFSDNTRSKYGRRKPFIIIGSIPLIIFAVLIYTPPLTNPWFCLIYLIIVLVGYEWFVTMVVTSWYSLFAEMSLKEKDRMDTAKLLQIFGIIGLIIGLGVAPMIAGSSDNPIVGYGLMGFTMALITVLAMLPTIFKVKEHPSYQVKKEDRIKFFESVKVSFKNKSFVYFIVVQFLLQLSYAVVVSSLPLFFEGVLGLGSLEYSVILLATFATVIPSLFLWIKIAEKKGVKFALFLSMICFSVVFPFTFLMEQIWIAIVIMLFAGIGLSGLMMFPTVLLGDVIDEDQTFTNKRREGYYTGVSGVIVKLSNAISWGLIGIVLTLFKIDRYNLNPESITTLNKIGLKVLIGIIPVFIIFLGLIFLLKYPLTGKRLKRVKDKVIEMNQEESSD